MARRSRCDVLWPQPPHAGLVGAVAGSVCSTSRKRLSSEKSAPLESTLSCWQWLGRPEPMIVAGSACENHEAAARQLRL